MLQEEITSTIINAYFKVYNTLGYGFLEKVYENALLIELEKNDLNSQQQHPIQVFYSDQLVGEYFCDILVNESVIVELKAAEKISHAHETQLINYLRATKIEVGLLLNFGTKPEFYRKIFTNDRKKSKNTESAENSDHHGLKT